jgi:hypothetical protein
VDSRSALLTANCKRHMQNLHLRRICIWVGAAWAAGALTAAAIAWLCIASIPPVRVAYTYSPNAILAISHEKWFGKLAPDGTYLGWAIGCGYRAVSIWNGLPETAHAQQPTASLTRFGWPNFAFATTSPNMDSRSFFSVSHPAPGAASGRIGLLMSVQIIWSGFCFNSAVFAAVYALPLAIVMRVDRRITLLIVTTGLAFVASLLLAWSLDLLHQVGGVSRQESVRLGASTVPARVLEFMGIDGLHDPVKVIERRSIGFRQYNAIWTEPGHGESFNVSASMIVLGWPCTALRGRAPDPFYVAGDPWPDETRNLHVVQLLATPVYWPGTLANTGIFTAATVCAVLLPRTLHRRIRNAKGRCEHCGYPAGASAVCSECGKHLNVRT